MTAFDCDYLLFDLTRSTMHIYCIYAFSYVAATLICHLWDIMHEGC